MKKVILLLPLLLFFTLVALALHSSRSLSCYSERIVTIHGNSLFPILNDSQKAILLEGYYKCNNISRNDIVAVKFKTTNKTFVKIVKALPGDLLEFRGSYAYVDGELLVNSQGEPYVFSERARKVLTIPLINGRVPENMYLVLGNRISEVLSFDSRYFGYVSREQIIGKVVK